MNTTPNTTPAPGVLDELEQLALAEVVKRRRFGAAPSALVIPAGKGDLAFELARLGAGVTAVESASHFQELQGRTLASGLREEVQLAAAAFDTPEAIPDGPFDLIFCRRGLCTLPYEEARKLVRQLLFKLKIGGKLYLSVLGLHSELGEGYAAGEAFIEQRFGPLSAPMAQKYGIQAPVCLYTERNLFMLLLESGSSVLRTFTTTHGNVKGVGVRV